MLPSPPPRPLSSTSRASSEYTVAIAKHSANSEYSRDSSGEYIVASGSACTAARSSSEGEEMTQLIELREQLRAAEQDITLAKEVLRMERANLTSEKKKWALDRNVEDQRWAEEMAQISRREKSIWGAKGKDSHLAFQQEQAKWDQERKSMMEKHRLELDDIMNLLINSEVLKAADGPAKRELERRSHEEQQRQQHRQQQQQHRQEALDLMSLLKSADDQKAALALAAENERKWEQERERLNCKIAELRVALANRLEVNFSQQTDLDRQLREAMERESKLHEDLRLQRQQSEEDCRIWENERLKWEQERRETHSKISELSQASEIQAHSVAAAAGEVSYKHNHTLTQKEAGREEEDAVRRGDRCPATSVIERKSAISSNTIAKEIESNQDASAAGEVSCQTTLTHTQKQLENELLKGEKEGAGKNHRVLRCKLNPPHINIDDLSKCSEIQAQYLAATADDTSWRTLASKLHEDLRLQRQLLEEERRIWEDKSYEAEKLSEQLFCRKSELMIMLQSAVAGKKVCMYVGMKRRKWLVERTLKKWHHNVSTKLASRHRSVVVYSSLSQRICQRLLQRFIRQLNYHLWRLRVLTHINHRILLRVLFTMFHTYSSNVTENKRNTFKSERASSRWVNRCLRACLRCWGAMTVEQKSKVTRALEGHRFKSEINKVNRVLDQLRCMVCVHLQNRLMRTRRYLVFATLWDLWKRKKRRRAILGRLLAKIKKRFQFTAFQSYGSFVAERKRNASVSSRAIFYWGTRCLKESFGFHLPANLFIHNASLVLALIGWRKHIRNERRRRKNIMKILLRSFQRILSRVWTMFVDYVDANNRRRVILDRAKARIENGVLFSAFHTYRSYVSEEKGRLHRSLDEHVSQQRCKVEIGRVNRALDQLRCIVAVNCLKRLMNSFLVSGFNRWRSNNRNKRRRRKNIMKILLRSFQRILSRVWTMFVDYVDANNRRRVILDRAKARIENGVLFSAFHTYRSYVSEEKGRLHRSLDEHVSQQRCKVEIGRVNRALDQLRCIVAVNCLKRLMNSFLVSGFNRWRSNNRNQRRRRKHIMKILLRSFQCILSRVWTMFVDYVDANNRRRVILDRAKARIENGVLFSAFHTYRSYVSEEKGRLHRSLDEHASQQRCKVEIGRVNRALDQLRCIVAVNCLKKLMNSFLVSGFNKWRSDMRNMRRLRVVGLKILKRWTSQILAVCFQEWCQILNIEQERCQMHNVKQLQAENAVLLRWRCAWESLALSCSLNMQRRWKKQVMVQAWAGWCSVSVHQKRMKALFKRAARRWRLWSLSSAQKCWFESCMQIKTERRRSKTEVLSFSRIIAGWMKRTLSQAWSTWELKWREAKGVRSAMKKVTSKVVGRMNNQMTWTVWNMWASNVADLKRMKAISSKVTVRWRNRTIAQALTRWKVWTCQTKRFTRNALKIATLRVMQNLSRAWKTWGFVSRKAERPSNQTRKTVKETAVLGFSKIFSGWMKRALSQAWSIWELKWREEKKLRSVTGQLLKRWTSRILVASLQEWCSKRMDKQGQSQMKAKAVNCLKRLMKSILVSGFNKWRSDMRNMRRLRVVGLKILKRWTSQILAVCFQEWCQILNIEQERCQMHNVKQLQAENAVLLRWRCAWESLALSCSLNMQRRWKKQVMVQAWKIWASHAAELKGIKAKDQHANELEALRAELQTAAKLCRTCSLIEKLDRNAMRKMLIQRTKVSLGMAWEPWSKLAKEQKRMVKVTSKIVVRVKNHMLWSAWNMWASDVAELNWTKAKQQQATKLEALYAELQTAEDSRNQMVIDLQKATKLAAEQRDLIEKLDRSAMRKMLGQRTKVSLGMAWETWSKHAKEQKRMMKVTSRIVVRVQNHMLWIAWNMWASDVAELKRTKANQQQATKLGELHDELQYFAQYTPPRRYFQKAEECGFAGSFQQVAMHESSCSKNPTSPNPANEMAIDLTMATKLALFSVEQRAHMAKLEPIVPESACDDDLRDNSMSNGGLVQKLTTVVKRTKRVFFKRGVLCHTMLWRWYNAVREQLVRKAKSKKLVCLLNHSCLINSYCLWRNRTEGQMLSKARLARIVTRLKYSYLINCLAVWHKNVTEQLVIKAKSKKIIRRLKHRCLCDVYILWMNKCARHRHAIAEQWWYIADKFVVFSSQLTQVEFYANQVENVLHHAALEVCKYSLRNAAEDHLHKRLTDLEEILAPFFQQADTNLEVTSKLTGAEAITISVQEILNGRFPSPAVTLDETNKAGNAACVKNTELHGERATIQTSYRALEQAAGRLAQEAEGYEQEVVRGRSALVEVEKELTWAQTRVKELERRLEEATKDAAALKTSKDELQATVASLREQVGSDKTRISFMEATISAGRDSSKALTEEMKRLEAARQLEKDAREACEREMATLRRDLENLTHLKSDTAQVEAGMVTRSISVEETLKRRFPSPPIRKKFEELDTQSPSPSKEASLLESSPLSNNIPTLQSAHISTFNVTSARHISSPAPRQTLKL